jgi:tetrahydromethanopterin S-methyltransferase subunit E
MKATKRAVIAAGVTLLLSLFCTASGDPLTGLIFGAVAAVGVFVILRAFFASPKAQHYSPLRVIAVCIAVVGGGCAFVFGVPLLLFS